MGVRMKILHLNNVSELLKQIPEGTVDMFVTSPPYWSLRDRPAKHRGRDGGQKRRDNNAKSRSKKPRSGRNAKDVE